MNNERDEEEIGLYDYGNYVEIVFRGDGIWPYEWSDKEHAKAVVEHTVRQLEGPLRELGASDQFDDDSRSKRFRAMFNRRDVWVSFPFDLVTMKLIRHVRQLIFKTKEEGLNLRFDGV